jgi:hypothetical protein
MITDLSDLFRKAKKALPAIFLERNSPAHLASLDARIKELTEERDAVITHLKENVQFEQILPDDDSSRLHQQLLDNEKVHPIGSAEELLKKRIGGLGANKRCYARVNRNDGDEEVTTGIFVALRKIRAKEQDVGYDDISGDIDEVKERPIEPFDVSEGETVEAILYTISGQHLWDKSGRELAAQVHEYLHREAAEQKYNLIISTLSPVRGFMNHLAGQHGFESSFTKDDDGYWSASDSFMDRLQDKDFQDDLKHTLLHYLLIGDDPVLNFHLGNGAQIGDIKFNPKNNQDWVMINYVYPDNPETLQQNAQIYKSGKRLLARHLNSFLDDTEHTILDTKIAQPE